MANSMKTAFGEAGISGKAREDARKINSLTLLDFAAKNGVGPTIDLVNRVDMSRYAMDALLSGEPDAASRVFQALFRSEHRACAQEAMNDVLLAASRAETKGGVADVAGMVLAAFGDVDLSVENLIEDNCSPTTVAFIKEILEERYSES